MTDYPPIADTLSDWLIELPPDLQNQLRGKHMADLLATVLKEFPVVPGAVVDRLIQGMQHHGTYDEKAAAVVRPSDLDVILKAVTRKDDLLS